MASSRDGPGSIINHVDVTSSDSSNGDQTEYTCGYHGLRFQ